MRSDLAEGGREIEEEYIAKRGASSGTGSVRAVQCDKNSV